MPRKKQKSSAGGIQSASGKVYKRGTTGAKLVTQAHKLSGRLHLKKQGALRVAARPPEPNYLRHVATYLQLQRQRKPLETSYHKRDRLAHPRTDLQRRLLKEECERRKARREVLHAKGHAGTKKSYPNRKPPGRRIKC